MTHRLDHLIGASNVGVIGVLNVTPDSFSDGGRFADHAAAVRHAEEMIGEGADLLDIGGESTAPGSVPIDAGSELARIETVVAELGPRFPLSIDTYRASTAARCLELGARMINDVSALRADPDLAAVVREHGVPFAIMHAKDGPLPHATDAAKHYDDVVKDVGDFLLERIDYALAQGIEQDALIVDPGWGRFLSLEPDDTWHLMANFEQLVTRLQPIPFMVCTSRKGFLAVPMQDRDPLSQLTALIGVIKGGRLIRTHRPKMARQFLDAAEHMALLAKDPG